MTERMYRFIVKCSGIGCLVMSVVCFGLTVQGVMNEEVTLVGKSAKLLLAKQDHLISFWLSVAFFFFGGIYCLVLGFVGLQPDRPPKSKKDGRGVLFTIAFLSLLLLSLFLALIWAVRL